METSGIEIKRMDHVGVFVEDLDGALSGFADLLGLDRGAEENFADLDIAFLGCGETQVELIRPRPGEQSVSAWLEAHGPGYNHVALEVESLESSLAELAAHGVEPIVGPQPGAGNTVIAFLDPTRFGGVLVELCEVRPALP